MSLTLENPTLIQAPHKMESKIQSAPLYPTRPTCKITHSSSSERLCQYRRTTKASWRGCTGLTQRLSAFPSFSKILDAGGPPGTKGTFRTPLGPGCSAFVWPRLEPPAARPASPTTPSSLRIFLHTHHSPMISCSEVSSPGAPSRSLQSRFLSKSSPDRLGVSPSRPGETPGQEGAPGWGLRETVTQSQA